MNYLTRCLDTNGPPPNPAIAVPSPNPLQGLDRYLRNAIFAIRSEHLKKGYFSEDLANHLMITLAPVVEPVPGFQFYKVVGAPPFIEKDQGLLHYRAAGRPHFSKMSLSIAPALRSSSACVRLDEITALPACGKAADRVVAPVSLDSSSKPSAFIGMTCPRTAVRDTVVHLTAPDRGCIRMVEISDE